MVGSAGSSAGPGVEVRRDRPRPSDPDLRGKAVTSGPGTRPMAQPGKRGDARRRDRGSEPKLRRAELTRASEEYLAYLVAEKGRSRNTMAAYRSDLAGFEGYLEAAGIRVDQCTTGLIEAYLAGKRGGGASGASMARALSCLRGLYVFLEEEGVVNGNPARLVSGGRADRRLPKALSVAEVQRLLEAPGDYSPLARRDQAILETLYGTGMRVSELVGLSVASIRGIEFGRGLSSGESSATGGSGSGSGNLHGSRPATADRIGTIRVMGKGRKERIVPVGEIALGAVARWLSVGGRPAIANRARRYGSADSLEALFLNARGMRLTRQGVWLVIQRRAAETGLAGRVHPHVLRHCFATHMLEGGADIRVVQELLGHASISTTQIYTKVSIEHLREEYELAHPRAAVARMRNSR